MRVANVPDEEFEQLVEESDNSPTVSRLADIGKKKRPSQVIDISRLKREMSCGAWSVKAPKRG